MSSKTLEYFNKNLTIRSMLRRLSDYSLCGIGDSEVGLVALRRRA